MKPEVAFYYPGQYWYSSDKIKNLVLFFDGIAMLIPSYMDDQGKLEDFPIVSSLKEHDLFHIIRPETTIGKKETEKLANALVDIIASGRLDHLSRDTAFGSLSMSRLGYYGDSELAEFVVQELKERGLAYDSEDGVSIPMHQTVRSLILVLLAQILRPSGESMGLTLSPATDRWDLVEALEKIVSPQTPSSPSVADLVSFDMAMVGVDVSSIPMNEILDFRKENYSQHRDYRLSVLKFARELSQMPAEDRYATFEQRQEELDDAASALRKLHRSAWLKPVSFGIGFAGAAWSVYSGNPIGGLIAAAGAISGLLSSQPEDSGVYSYLFSAKNSLR